MHRAVVAPARTGRLLDTVMDTPIYTLKVTIRDIRPAIWRRIEVSPDTSLFELHRTLQAAMGWTDSHLHQFLHRGTYYGAPDREFGMPIVSERRTKIGEPRAWVGGWRRRSPYASS